MKKQLFIVIDGTDATGKKTQTALLVEACKAQGISVKTTDFPRYKNNVFGALIRECLDGKHGDFIRLDPKIASTLYAVDRFESSDEIRSWLDEGNLVISDRYVSANQIHQAGKIEDPIQRKEFLEWLEKAEYGVFKIPRPDVIFYLDLPVEISLRLIKERARKEGVDPDAAESDAKHLQECQERALETISQFGNWIRIDCSRDGEIKSKEEIHQLILGELKRLLE